MHVEEELRTYLQVLWRYKWIIAACAMIAAVVALGVSFFLTPLYSATATVRVASAPGGTYDYSYISSFTRLSNTYVEIATSDTSLNKVVERLKLDKPPKVEVEIVPETELIKITASDPDPSRARDIVNTLADLLVEESLVLYGGNAPTAREILEGQLQQAKIDLDKAVSDYDASLRTSLTTPTPKAASTPMPNPDLDILARLVSVRQQIYSDLLQKYETARTNEQLRTNAITVFEYADIPIKPSSPKKPLNAALGLFGGLLLGGILTFLLEGMDDTVRGIEDIQTLTTLPILSKIPELRQIARLPKGNSSPAPAFNQLGTRLSLFTGEKRPATFLITSPEPGAGKSTIVANLAVSLSQGGNKVILVDMDFRRPRQHSILGLMNGIGLSNYLCGEIHLDEALQVTEYKNLRVITAGTSQHVPLEWLTPVKINTLLDELSKECDFVLIDAPAFLSVADPMVLASVADVVLLVVARRKTERQNLRSVLQQLSEMNAKIAGIIINRVDNAELYSYYSLSKSKSSFLPTIKNPLNK